MCSQRKSVIKLPHHEQQEYALDRPLYRQGKKLTAVKVYTVNDESQHLLVFDVPQIKLKDELHRLASKFGIIKSLTLLNNYENEDKEKFTDVYHLHYRRIQAARFAKRQLDEKCFFGGVLHVCYAPELETVSETRVKLIQRRREIAARIAINKQSSASKSSVTKTRILQRSKKHPALPLPQQPEFNPFSNNQFNNPSTATSTYNANVIQPCLIQVTDAHHQTSEVIHMGSSDGFYQNVSALSEGSKNSIHTSSVQSPCIKALDLSEENIRALKFLPRQISRTPIVKNKSKIVFHRK